MRAWRGMLLIIDKAANAFLVDDSGQFIKERPHLHETILAGMTVGSNLFATSGSDGSCKVWDE